LFAPEELDLIQQENHSTAAFRCCFAERYQQIDEICGQVAGVCCALRGIGAEASGDPSVGVNRDGERFNDRCCSPGAIAPPGFW
jgi:hypothetical protein